MNRSHSGRCKQGIRAALSCALAVWMTGRASALASAANLADTRGREVNDVHPTTAEESRSLGQLRVGDIHFIRLPIAAAEGAPIGIKGVEASCGCMQVLGYPATAGKNAEISLRYVALKEGPIAVNVMIETDVPANRFIEFAFKGMVVAGDRSRAIMIESIAPELFRHRDAPISPGILVSGAEARTLVERGAMLVDVRSVAERAGSGPVNALEIPLHELRSKPFLAAQPIVLLGSPALSEQTLETIDLLRTGGKAGALYYVDGGVAGWVAAGGAVMPKEAANSFLSDRVISANELHAMANRNRYLLVDATDDELASIYLPESVRLPTRSDDFAVMSEAVARIRADAGGRTLLLVTKDMSSQKAASAALRDSAIWFLEGGLATYRNFLAAQTQSLLARRDGRNVVHARQGAVTSSFPRELLNSGCSSCPGRH